MKVLEWAATATVSVTYLAMVQCVVVSGTVCAAIGVIISKREQRDGATLPATLGTMLTAPLLAVIFMLAWPIMFTRFARGFYESIYDGRVKKLAKPPKEWTPSLRPIQGGKP